MYKNLRRYCLSQYHLKPWIPFLQQGESAFPPAAGISDFVLEKEQQEISYYIFVI